MKTIPTPETRTLGAVRVGEVIGRLRCRFEGIEAARLAEDAIVLAAGQAIHVEGADADVDHTGPTPDECQSHAPQSANPTKPSAIAQSAMRGRR
jgi:hypothetical protein